VIYRFGKANVLKQLEVTLLGFLKPIQNRYQAAGFSNL